MTLALLVVLATAHLEDAHFVVLAVCHDRGFHSCAGHQGRPDLDLAAVADGEHLVESEFLADVREPLATDVDKTRKLLRMYAAEAPKFGQSINDVGSLMETLGRVLSYRNGLTNYFCALDLTVGPVRISTSTLPLEYSEVCR